MKPYSAISFLRSSSSFFFAFLLLQNHRPKITRPMTAAMGMMTAIAIVAALLRPLVEPPFDPDALRAVWVDEEVAEVRVDDIPVPAVGEMVRIG